MWCGECGRLMQRRDDGAWNGCCNRLGYWTQEPPLVGDRWYPIDAMVPKGFYFYATAKWPKDKRPHVPVWSAPEIERIREEAERLYRKLNPEDSTDGNR